MRSVARSLAAASLVYGLGSSINGIVGFVLIPLYVHRLLAAEYGRFALAEAVLNLLLIALGLGLNVALLARYPRINRENRPRFVRSVFGFLLISTLAIETSFLLIVPFVGRLVLPILPFRYYFLVAVISALETVWLLFATLYRAEGWAWRYITASVVQVCVSLSTTVVLIVHFGLHDEGILYGRLLGDIALVTLLLRELPAYTPRFDFEPIRGLLRLGLPLLPATFASIWIAMAPRYSLQWFGTTSDVGVFAMSTKMAGVVTVVFAQPFALSWIPIMFRVYEREDARRVYGKVVTYSLLLGGAVALACGLIGPSVVALLARKDFAFRADLLLLLCCANVLAGMTHAVNIGPYVREKTLHQVPVFVTVALLSIPITLGCAKALGVVGAGSAMLSLYLIQGVLLNRMSQRLYSFRLEYGRMALVLTVLAIGYVAAAWLFAGVGVVAAAFVRPLFFLGFTGAILSAVGFFRETGLRLPIASGSE